MSISTATAFSNLLSTYENEISTRVKELKGFAKKLSEDEENTQKQNTRATKLVWFDELASVEESLNTQTELLRAGVKLETLANLTETAVSQLENAIGKAEDIAILRHGYKQPLSSIPINENQLLPPLSPHRNKLKTPQKKLQQQQKMTPKRSATPKTSIRITMPSPALSDPPTPKLEDLGFSSATLNLLQKV